MKTKFLLMLPYTELCTEPHRDTQHNNLYPNTPKTPSDISVFTNVLQIHAFQDFDMHASFYGTVNIALT